MTTTPLPVAPAEEIESACDVCGLIAPAEEHPCAFATACRCWWGEPCGVPHCDECGRAEDVPDDWNGNTGNHRSCEYARPVA